MKALLNDLGITTKLLLSSFLTLTGVVVLTCILVVADHYQDSKVRLLTEAAARVELTAYNLAPALDANDPRGAQRVIASLELTPSVLAARLFDRGGRSVAEYSASRRQQVDLVLDLPADAGHRFTADYLETYRPVVAQGKIIGVLVIATGLTGFRTDLAAYGIKAGLIATIALVLAYVVTASMQRTILQPMGALTAFMHRVLDEKRYDLRAKVAGRDEIGALAGGVNALLERIFERESSLHRELAERTQSQRRFDELAHYDSVTKLPNRQYFARQFERVLLGATQSGSAGALILIDLSNFKMVNESHGHDAGDSLLLQLANRLTSVLRGSDLLCRLGGDEFGLILDQTSGESHIAAVAEKMLAVVRQPIPLGEREIEVGASVGIAVFPVDGKEPQVLLRRAETAAQRAKASGKNTYCFFSPDMLDRTKKGIDVDTDLRRALDQGELRLYFQPQVAMENGRLRGLEAFLRWQHPQHGLLLPGEFIALAEENSVLIGAIADWTLDAACAQIAAWRNAGLEAVPIAVNFSAAQLRDSHMAKRLSEVLSRYGVPGELIELEITENQLMSESRHSETLDELRKLGVGIAIANFGTGYSSLGHLKDLPITTLKIDRGFVHRVTDSARFAAITRAIVDLATDLGFDTVAEGVESTRQVEFLRAMGCRAYQGYCFSPAVPADEAERFLQSRVTPIRRSAVAGG